MSILVNVDVYNLAILQYIMDSLFVNVVYAKTLWNKMIL